jgi:septal ring factor EnvC (AmiA/AmiB activator)
LAFFARQPTPEDCIDRLARIVDELPAVMQMMDAVTRTRAYEADWNANRTYARDHLMEAWYSVERALNGLTVSKREPTWDGRAATVETQRKHLVALRAEVKRLAGALAVAETRAAAVEAEMAQRAPSSPRGGEELARKLRLVVMWAVHPDRAADAAERKWRTQLCQTLFPEMDRAMDGA